MRSDGEIILAWLNLNHLASRLGFKVVMHGTNIQLSLPGEEGPSVFLCVDSAVSFLNGYKAASEKES